MTGEEKGKRSCHRSYGSQETPQTRPSSFFFVIKTSWFTIKTRDTETSLKMKTFSNTKFIISESKDEQRHLSVRSQN